MYKKQLGTALVCAALLALSGCGGKEPEATDSPVAGEETLNQETSSQETPEQQTPAPKEQAILTYEFSGTDAGKAGYAEGTLSFKASEAGTYCLYWSDERGALNGYYEITEFETKEGETVSFSFDYHTAIPADAVKVIAAAKGTGEYPTLTDAVAVYDIPAEKQLAYASGDALYTFQSFSDIHIDEEHFGEINGSLYWWEYSEAHWANALAYAADRNTDFIISSGDQVTNANLDTLDEEWRAYQLILAQSDYVKPIYESGGNHEVRQDGAIAEELHAFVVGSGLDSSMDTLAADKPYYSMEEPSTGDLFIFMALEAGYKPAKYDQFSDEQLDWVESLLEENYGKGKNIYIVQHALLRGYGPGDDPETPYYGGALNPEFESAKRFISILESHPDVIWISGHSHEAFSLGYNYTNNNGESCNMIHNPSVGNPTHVTDGAIDYTFNEELSQGYYVQTFETEILFNGVNLYDGKIYPAYSYIIDGRTALVQKEEKEEFLYPDVEVTAGTLRSLLANVNTVLGLYYEFSSYDQYQTLKQYYYQYKDADISAMKADDLLLAYSRMRLAITCLHQIVLFTAGETYEIILPEPAVPETAARENDLLVRIHYHREDGQYEPWLMWLWAEGNSGSDNFFTGTDDFGVYLEYTATPDVTSLGFIVKTETWAKDVDADQFIALDGITGTTLDVYIESGVAGYQVAEAEKGEVLVRIHYHREDGKYEPWLMWLWAEGKDGSDNYFTGTDDFGVYLEYTATPDVTSLGFIVKTESWDKDVSEDQFISLEGVTGGTMDVYIESGVAGYDVR